jgi:hypothetical protein
MLAVIVYWTAVRVGGATCFHYAKSKRDEKDLAAAMVNYLPKGTKHEA